MVDVGAGMLVSDEPLDLGLEDEIRCGALLFEVTRLNTPQLFCRVDEAPNVAAESLLLALSGPRQNTARAPSHRILESQLRLIPTS